MTRTDRNQWIWLVALSVVLTGLCVWIGTRPAPQTDPLPELVTGADGVGRAMGRVEDVESANSFRERQPVQWFGDTPAGRAKLAAGDEPTILTDASKKVLGHEWIVPDQGQVGSCVGANTAQAANILQLVQIARGEQSEYKEASIEVIYAGSRVEIGGGRIRGDGSVGAWAAQWLQKFGIVSMEVHGKYDLRKYLESRCREWGRTGVPDDLEPIAKKSPVKGVVGIRNVQELIKAAQQGYPSAVCSDQGFNTTRDKDGFLRPSGTWNHCMCVAGVRGGKRPGVLFCNSWNTDWVNGPEGEYDIPPGCFWVDLAVADRMCRQNDTWAFSDAVGFPSRDPFFIAVPRRVDVAVQFPKPDWTMAP